MIQRCRTPKNTNYAQYGGRGISVCEKWQKFVGFLEDMGERPAGLTLDRIDVNGNYSKDNCRWTDAKTQQRNMQNTAYLTAFDVTAPLADWADALEVRANALSHRLMRGWSDEEIVTEPIIRKPRKRRA